MRSPSQATQVPAEQIGFVAVVHAALVRQATHVFVVVLQVGVAGVGVHCVSSRHATQICFTRLHFGVRPPQLTSLEQPAVQV